MLKKDFNKSILVFLVVAVSIVKIVLTYFQFATIYPPLAPIDDDLMFKAAVSITNGEWLGDYNYLTISKHMFFSIWLSFLHMLNIPYLVGNCLLWILASFYTVYSFSPVIKKNISKLFLYCGVLYNPANTACYTTRIYRDSIFPALCLIFFLSVIAIALRFKKPMIKSIINYIIMGILFGVIYLTREDGFWVLPFLFVGMGIVFYKLFATRQNTGFCHLGCFALAILIAAGIISSYSYMNYKYYGRFIVSDFTSSEFKQAYGAMTSLEQDNFNPLVAVPSDVREDLYREVPSFALIKDELNDEFLKNSYYSTDEKDFLSGSFYWVFRTALQNKNIYKDALTAENYLVGLRQEIQTAVDEGRLKTQNGSDNLRNSVTSPIKLSYVPNTFIEWLNSMRAVVLFEQCGPLAEIAVGEPEDIKNIENYIHQKGITAFVGGTDKIYFNIANTLTHTFLNIMVWVYRIFIPIMMIVTVIWQKRRLTMLKYDSKENIDNLLSLIITGLLGMGILRCAMIAFVEVSAFGIGTYGMYLSPVYPLLIIYSFIGTIKLLEDL